MVAAVADHGKELVAELNMQPKPPQCKKSAAKGCKRQVKLCNARKKYGDHKWKCMDPCTCIWLGNEQAQQQQQPPPWATLAVFSTWWTLLAPSGSWWNLAAPSASFPTSLQLSPQGHA